MTIQNSCSFQNVTAATNAQPINPFGMQLVKTSTATTANVDFLNLNAYPTTGGPYNNFLFIFSVYYGTVANNSNLQLVASSTAGSITSQNSVGYLSDVVNYNGAAALTLNNSYSATQSSLMYMYSMGGTAPQFVNGYLYMIGMNSKYLSVNGIIHTVTSAASSGSTFNRSDWISGGGIYGTAVPAFRFVNGAGTVTTANYALYALPSL